MPNTTNNNWPTPADTDLVKNGADAIRDLGNAIDTTLGVYSPVTPGLTLINTTSFSGVASQALPANTFNSSYANYKIILTINTPTADAAIYLKMRASGTDNSVNYYWGALGITSAGTTTNDIGNNVTSGFLINAVDSNSPAEFYMTDITLGTPFTNTKTTIIFPYVGLTAAGALLSRYGSGWHDVTASYDSVNIIASSGNITGNIRVYGMNQ
jgi:hypothetical protein